MSVKKSLVSFLVLGSAILFISMIFQSQPVLAQGNLLEGQEGMGEVSAVFGQSEDLRATIVKIINVVLGLVGIIFLILIIISGFKYMTAAGNEEQVKKAVKQIGHAVIGLIIILAAWGISIFIIQRIVAASSG